jgi:hypothetical protein
VLYCIGLEFSFPLSELINYLPTCDDGHGELVSKIISSLIFIFILACLCKESERGGVISSH